MTLDFAKMRATLEFPAVLDLLADCALSQTVKERIYRLEPYLNQAEAARHMAETGDAKKILDTFGTPPLAAMQDLETSLSLAGSGAMLRPDQLNCVALFLTTCRRMRGYLRRAEEISPAVAFYGRSLQEPSGLEEEISRCLRGDMVDDHASPQLYSLRKKMQAGIESVKAKLENLLRTQKKCFADSYIAMRGERFTLPVKKEYKAAVPGTVVDISQSGGTLFIEPTAVRKAQEELAMLQIEEENEVLRILYHLTALVDAALPALHLNVETMQALDFVFAKARLSQRMQAREVPIIDARQVVIHQGRHPLLPQERVVPLDFHIGDSVHGVVITGPNTGGKTVALKTVGLLSLMAQSGLHVPVGEGSRFAMQAQVLCDIGDGQSISENLSTFSAHMTGIIEILRVADADSLVLLDELGTGTDPAEGMGLAIAILEALAQTHCLLLATTHYPEIKDFAAHTPGFCNARMTFDHQNLQPLYRLEIGTAGESCALAIAARLGLADDLIARARQIAYRNEQENSAPLLLPELAATVSSDWRGAIRPQQRLRRPKSGVKKQEIPYNVGDSVSVLPQGQIGIVYQSADERGLVGVQVQGRKTLVNHKRLRLQIAAAELYPEQYDLAIVFDAPQVRKARKLMTKRHVAGNVLHLSEESK